MALNFNHTFLNEDFQQCHDPMQIPYHERLKEIFPEMNFDELEQLMANLKDSASANIVATCRYEYCRYVRNINKQLTK